jgi:serine/threonine-protein kinase
VSPDAPSTFERVQRALGSEYVLERELGGGPVARVFVARETALDRRVVIKVLNPDFAVGVSGARFEREIALAARLQHPHLLPVLSAAVADAHAYYTTPFVEGESLRARLRREGALPIPEIVRLLREIADALAYAHGEGVVHRDLKPDNVLLSHGHAIVADFGVAKAIAASRRPGLPAGAVLTSAGVALGTPAYMAPEQALADPTADHRADLYSLGVLAYELLAGAPPFTGRVGRQLVAAHIAETPPPLAARRPEAPAALVRIVEQLLAKDPAARPQSGSVVMRLLDESTTPLPSEPTRGTARRRWWSGVVERLRRLAR